MVRGKFIVLEGIDGSGKTTAIQCVSDYYTSLGIKNITTREPGGTPVAESIRSLLLSPEHLIDRDTEILLFSAARCHHITHNIEPALKTGNTVICDRYVDSSLAYQSTSLEHMRKLSQWTHSFDWLLVPDITLYFRIDVQTATARRMMRGVSSVDRIEQSLTERTHYISACYEELAQTQSHCKIIDATQSKESVNEQIISILQSLS